RSAGGEGGRGPAPPPRRCASGARRAGRGAGFRRIEAGTVGRGRRPGDRDAAASTAAGEGLRSGERRGRRRGEGGSRCARELVTAGRPPRSAFRPQTAPRTRLGLLSCAIPTSRSFSSNPNEVLGTGGRVLRDGQRAALGELGDEVGDDRLEPAALKHLPLALV